MMLSLTMNVTFLTLILAGAMCLLPGFAYSATCKIAKTPDGAKVQLIAPDMRINGMENDIRAFNTTSPVETVLAYYRNLWASLATAKRPGYLEQNMNEWRLISTVEGDCFTTVQVRSEGNGSYALVSVIKKPDGTAKVQKLGANFPLLPGSKVLSDLDYADGVRNARTVVISNKSDMAANVQFYRDEFKSRGWTQIMQRQPESKNGVSYVMVMKKGFEEASIVLSRVDGQVQVIANIVDRP
ncbi:MAG TPA: hypothetical protein VK949_04875 [Methylotenera sp.]|nr:hypothetical protein [Methylotenera sp.]